MRKFFESTGATYRGTFQSGFGMAPSDGITLLEFSSFEDFDVWRELEDPTAGKLMMESMEFTERGGATEVYEQAPEAFTDVVVRKHKGKRKA